jgi:indole-3-pyruvate monooxygenase
MTLQQTQTLIIGAGISGLASAASLKKKQIEYTIIEKQDRIAVSWRNHYDRLHLHTPKKYSGLPFKKFAVSIPRYPSRQQVVDYLEDYQKEFGIGPVFNTEALSVKRDGDRWFTETTGDSFSSKYVLIASGVFGRGRAVRFKGMETFPGRIMHSGEYKTGRDFCGQKILVVGFGNSSCEIAIDLYESGATPCMSVRSPVNVIPRDVLGIPVLELSQWMNRLSPRLADRVSAPLIRWLTGDIRKLGLQRMPYGPLEQIRRDGKAPVLDIGTIQHIREGHISICGEIDFIESRTIYFKDGKKDEFDAIVGGIGYHREYPGFMDLEKERFEDLELPVSEQKYFGKDGLYFCGYWISPRGQIFEIARDAQKIAKDIAKKEINGI